MITHDPKRKRLVHNRAPPKGKEQDDTDGTASKRVRILNNQSPKYIESLCEANMQTRIEHVAVWETCYV